MNKLLLIPVLFLAACASKDPALQPAVLEKVDCTVDFADFHAPLDVNSKKYRSAEQEVRDETERITKQKAVFRSGEELEFVGGGCAHITYSFTYSKVKHKHKHIAATVQRAVGLLKKTDVTDKKKEPLLAALKKAEKVNAKEIVEKQFELDCKPAVCTLDAREDGVIKLEYDFAP